MTYYTVVGFYVIHSRLKDVNKPACIHSLPYFWT